MIKIAQTTPVAVYRILSGYMKRIHARSSAGLKYGITRFLTFNALMPILSVQDFIEWKTVTRMTIW